MREGVFEVRVGDTCFGSTSYGYTYYGYTYVLWLYLLWLYLLTCKVRVGDTVVASTGPEARPFPVLKALDVDTVTQRRP